MAVFLAGPDSAWVSEPRYSGPVTPAFLRYSGDGLGDGDDVGLVERGLQGRSAVAGGAEDDTLLGDFGIGDEVIVFADNLIDIDQICWGGGLTRIVCYHAPYSATFFSPRWVRLC